MNTEIGKKTVTEAVIGDDCVTMINDPRSIGAKKDYFLSPNTVAKHCQNRPLACPSLRFVRGGWHYCTLDQPGFTTNKDHRPPFDCPISKAQKNLADSISFVIRPIPQIENTSLSSSQSEQVK